MSRFEKVIHDDGDDSVTVTAFSLSTSPHAFVITDEDGIRAGVQLSPKQLRKLAKALRQAADFLDEEHK